MTLGGHDIRRTANRWSCDCCRAYSATWASLAPFKCSGSAAAAWATRAARLSEVAGHRGGGSDGAGHSRFLSDSVVWCDTCGCYADNFAVALARPCSGRPNQGSGSAHCLKLLRQGIHPRLRTKFRSGPFPEARAGAQSSPSEALVDRRRVKHKTSFGLDLSIAIVKRRWSENKPMPSIQGAAKEKLQSLRDRVRSRLAAFGTPASAVSGEDSAAKRPRTLQDTMVDRTATTASVAHAAASVASQPADSPEPAAKKLRSHPQMEHDNGHSRPISTLLEDRGASSPCRTRSTSMCSLVAPLLRHSVKRRVDAVHDAPLADSLPSVIEVASSSHERLAFVERQAGDDSGMDGSTRVPLRLVPAKLVAFNGLALPILAGDALGNSHGTKRHCSRLLVQRASASAARR